MKPTVHIYYTRSSIQREIASARKSGKSQTEKTSSRAAHEEERRPWMNELPNEEAFGEEGAMPERVGASVRRGDSIPIRESTPELRFNELILAIHSMTIAITTMQRQLNKPMEVHEEPKIQVSPPRPNFDDREESHEEDRANKEPSMRRSHSLRDRESTYHGST